MGMLKENELVFFNGLIDTFVSTGLTTEESLYKIAEAISEKSKYGDAIDIILEEIKDFRKKINS